MLERAKSLFPTFAELAPDFEIENVLPGLSQSEANELDASLGIPLPESYKELLKCARGFWLMDGCIQFDEQHPFFHTFPALEELSPPQQEVVKKRGGIWPPPSDGMLCIAEFSMEADGDQILFDVRNGLINGEYPVVYYAHSANPPGVRFLSASFTEFMNEFLEYEEFSEED